MIWFSNYKTAQGNIDRTKFKLQRTSKTYHHRLFHLKRNLQVVESSGGLPPEDSFLDETDCSGRFIIIEIYVTVVKID